MSSPISAGRAARGRPRRWRAALLAVLLPVSTASAQDAIVRGTVLDPQGATVADARVTLLREGAPVGATTTDAGGEFAFRGLAEGRYQAEALAEGFGSQRSDPAFAGSVVWQLVLPIGPLRQDVVVTAAAGELPAAQVGAPVTRIDLAVLRDLGKVDVLEPLRIVPGVQVAQTGSRGSTTSLYVRGGNSNFNKVIVDGLPVNDLGGAFDFAHLATVGVDSVEVLRSANSVLFGSDALSGVVNITTRRGRTPQPEAAYTIDAGTLGTLRQAASVAGTAGRFDYFSEIGRFTTDNDLPNNGFRNLTYSGRFGVFAGRNTDVNGTVRWADTGLGAPNAVLYYGLADDSSQDHRAVQGTISAQSQISERLRTVVRFGVTDQKSRYVNPAPTGEAFDPFGFGANYLGDTVTIRGANGFGVSGRAILDFGGAFPSVFDATASRRIVSGQAEYRVARAVSVAAGGRFEREQGSSASSVLSQTTRKNGGLFVEGRVTGGSRVYVSGGVGYEHNAVFGSAATPRVSVAVYARNASAGAFGDTKVTFNAGTGIKAPSLLQEQAALASVIPPGSPLAALVPDIGPERSRALDVGIEQGFWRGRSRARVAYFDNAFRDLIEFVSDTVLPQLGVPREVAEATGFGAYVNSSSFTARGVEVSGEVMAGPVRVAAWYTFLAAEVTKSLSGGALAPAVNPAFPGIPIGQFSPLVGARPFRRPQNSGSVMVSYARGPAQVALAASLVGKRDDSTYLSDGFFGYSMLLPNEDLLGGYQKVDVSGSYRLHRRLRWYVSIENALDRTYQPAPGFLALPAAVRSGVTVAIGGGEGS